MAAQTRRVNHTFYQCPPKEYEPRAIVTLPADDGLVFEYSGCSHDSYEKEGARDCFKCRILAYKEAIEENFNPLTQEKSLDKGKLVLLASRAGKMLQEDQLIPHYWRCLNSPECKHMNTFRRPFDEARRAKVKCSSCGFRFHNSCYVFNRFGIAIGSADGTVMVRGGPSYFEWVYRIHKNSREDCGHVRQEWSCDMCDKRRFEDEPKLAKLFNKRDKKKSYVLLAGRDYAEQGFDELIEDLDKQVVLYKEEESKLREKISELSGGRPYNSKEAERRDDVTKQLQEECSALNNLQVVRRVREAESAETKNSKAKRGGKSNFSKPSKLFSGKIPPAAPKPPTAKTVPPRQPATDSQFYGEGYLSDEYVDEYSDEDSHLTPQEIHRRPHVNIEVNDTGRYYYQEPGYSYPSGSRPPMGDAAYSRGYDRAPPPPPGFSGIPLRPAAPSRFPAPAPQPEERRTYEERLRDRTDPARLPAQPEPRRLSPEEQSKAEMVKMKERINRNTGR
ncbi:hypothetical protein B0T26DRAFT_765604 [Lasiosphaeria miniovina]|uniref:Uncharacterized protein n=1 Tax=Lasiosphaeria miniovina TaxID=1954250 RepID=A0AA40B4G0_9PEZI|nr:uncharacterized protein B0T26DRAFT_765604 [Lasiosphaeria miniovina]KAK0727526.1 hypothetical protein B0T26DRAFT_765604 [Lasiosphaeria miniovina]